MLAIARGLMSEPRILLLDEPSLGLAPLMVLGIFKMIQALNRDGLTILLVEQNAQKALTIADYAYVLETGRMVAEGEGKRSPKIPSSRKPTSVSKSKPGTQDRGRRSVWRRHLMLKMLTSRYRTNRPGGQSPAGGPGSAGRRR